MTNGPSNIQRKGSTVMIAFIACLMFLWPSLLNRGPIFFADSLPYLQGAATGFEAMLGIETPWADADKSPEAQAIKDTSLTDVPQAVSSQNEKRYVVSTARSPWYGSTLYLGMLVGGSTLALLIQIISVVIAIVLTTRMVVPKNHALIAVLATAILATPIAVFACLFMPDVFTGIAILAVVNLIAFGHRLSRSMQLIWFILLLGAMLFHTSHFLISVVLLPIGIIIAYWITKRIPVTALFVIICALIGTAGAQSGFGRLVEKVYGEPPMRPPFLSARIIADGPGYKYLQKTCPTNGYALCAYLQNMPIELSQAGAAPWYSDVFLWSDNPKTGAFNIADTSVRRQLSDEQISFTIDVLRHDPIALIKTSVSNGVQQLYWASLDELKYDVGFGESLAQENDAFGLGEVENTRLYQGVFPFRSLDILFLSSAVISLIIVLRTLLKLRNHPRQMATPATNISNEQSNAPANELGLFLILILAGVILNALITGVLSGPHDRYQARVIWLIVLSATLAIAWFKTNAPKTGHS
jgi:hypothetical protein